MDLLLSNAPASLYRFGPFELRPRDGLLLKEGRCVKLQPKAAHALGLLAGRPRILIARSVLKKALWPGVFVTDNSLVQVIARVRRALDDTARPHRYVRTVSGRGYCFIGEVVASLGPSTEPDRPPVAKLADWLRRVADTLDASL
ncbi:MAG: winged helix-turn-helix domain-containing protein [Myxococcota bacterium]